LTIDSIRQMYPSKKMLVIFDPISATARSSLFQNEFTESLALAEKIILTDNKLKTTAKNQNDIDLNLVASDLRDKFKRSACVVDNLEQLRSEIDKLIDEKSVLLVLSNRTCLGLWESSFVNELS